MPNQNTASVTFLDRLLWSNVIIAASAAGWVLITLMALRLPFDALLVALAFALTLAFYTRDRLDQREQRADRLSMPARTGWVRQHTTALKAVMWSAFAAAIGLVILRPGVLPPLLAGLGFALSYTVRWLPWRGERRGWKHLPGVKMPFVALLWVVTVVFAPAAQTGHLWQLETWRLAGAVWLLVMAQILLNDLRDVAADSAGGTASLPVLVGVRPARWIGGGLALLSLPLAGGIAWPVFPLTALYTVSLLWGYNPRHDAAWRFWIEAQGLVAGVIVGVFWPR
jgi:hypothetical protein